MSETLYSPFVERRVIRQRFRTLKPTAVYVKDYVNGLRVSVQAGFQVLHTNTSVVVTGDPEVLWEWDWEKKTPMPRLVAPFSYRGKNGYLKIDQIVSDKHPKMEEWISAYFDLLPWRESPSYPSDKSMRLLVAQRIIVDEWRAHLGDFSLQLVPKEDASEIVPFRKQT